MGYTRYKTLIINYLQIFFTNKWHKGNHRITPNSGRAFYFMIHYVVYRFYRKRSTEDRDICLLYACCLNLTFFSGLILGVAHFLCKLLEIQNIINKSFVYFYVIISLLFEYLVFFRKDRYLKIFTEYEKQIDTPAMKRKMKNAKIFNYSIFIVDIIMLFISDYLNHHGG